MRRRDFLILVPSISFANINLAFSQDPVSVEKMIEIAVAAWNYSQDSAEKKGFEAWKSNVSKRLDSILENTEIIIRELKNLRVYFKDVLNDEFRFSFERRLESQRKSLDDVMAGIPVGGVISDRMANRLQLIADNIRHDLYATASYGFATLPFVISGYTSLMMAMKLAKTSDLEIESTRNRIFDDFFVRCLSEDEVGSFAWALKEASKKRESLRNEFEKNIRTGVIGVTGHPCCILTPKKHAEPSIMQWLFITIDGNVENPASITRSSVSVSNSIELPRNITYDVMRLRWKLSPAEFPEPKPFSVMAGWLPTSRSRAEEVANQVVASLGSISQDYLLESSKVSTLTSIVSAIHKIFPDKIRQYL